MDERRILRVSELVREELTEMVAFEMEDPRLVDAEITVVEVSPDSQYAKVKVALRGDERSQNQAIAALTGASGYWLCGASWHPGCNSGRFRNCALRRIRIPTLWAEWTSCYGGRKNLGAVTKINPKVQQNVIVLFLLAASAANAQQTMLRLEKSADAMGSTYSIALYGYDRVRMEAAADAAFDEVRQLDDLLSNYKPDGEWSE